MRETIDPAVECDERATDHRQAALEALSRDQVDVAMMHAVLTVGERISELCCYVARLG